MNWLNKVNWVKVSLISFLIVSFYGVVMRYKIGFEFPFFNQKNLQHAHSHFAFAGWVSLLLMVLMVRLLGSRISEKVQKKYYLLFAVHFIVALGSLISFTIQGYGLVSIIFSVVSILLSFLFALMYFQSLRKVKEEFVAKKWLLGAILFSVLSAAGTFYLSYMMATKNLEQNHYLASVYWYLHFQYNGWFFFACAGLFTDYLNKKSALPKSMNRIFWFFAIACIPGYGLSVLWWDLPVWLYTIVCIAALVQFYAVSLFFVQFFRLKKGISGEWNTLIKFLLLFVGFSLILKLLLQLGSTIPAIAKFAFGFRPIVIAYLHLVLLAFTSLFLILYLYLTKTIPFSRIATYGVWILAIGILLNELLLALQGVFSLNYTLVPYANEMLFGVSVLIFTSLLLINFSKK